MLKRYVNIIKDNSNNNDDCLQYKREAQDIANNLRESQAYANLRDMTESIYGTWYTTCDSNLISYSGNNFKPTLKL